jgi:hypothetical protein
MLPPKTAMNGPLSTSARLTLASAVNSMAGSANQPTKPLSAVVPCSPSNRRRPAIQPIPMRAKIGKATVRSACTNSLRGLDPARRDARHAAP